ncbi:MAG: glycosyltransferase family 2 protein, partial [Thermodesulfovibrionia bacterium]|nr:glycosyltransferase family 2 protein [Thermodesulfovibrionia bacterium]
MEKSDLIHTTLAPAYRLIKKFLNCLLPFGSTRRDRTIPFLRKADYLVRKLYKRSKKLIYRIYYKIRKDASPISVLAAGWSNFAREYQKLNEELRKQPSAGMPLYKISIVSVLHNKSREINYFLEALMQQTYKGQFEIIFVDDTSSDGSAEIAQKYFDEAKRKNESEHIPELAIIKNDKNMGNCHSRNRGISNAGGDIIVVIDSDCIVNKDFLSSHAYAHMLDDCEVVVGPMNIESDGEDPFDLLNSYESSPEKIISESQMQDPINTQSFLNCVTRNFSIKKRFINGELFDPLFSYSKDPLSGF